MIANQIVGIGSGATPPKPVVTGGTVTNDGTYYYRTFTGNGTLGITVANLPCDLILVAGGGGSGCAQNATRGGGGGGAGGLRYSASQTLTPNNYSVVIGGGGAGATYSPAAVGTNVFDA